MVIFDIMFWECWICERYYKKVSLFVDMSILLVFEHFKAQFLKKTLVTSAYAIINSKHSLNISSLH
jgi:hypothetical protein